MATRSGTIDRAPQVSTATQVTATVIGNALEWYDFTVYGTLAVTISGLFFPADVGDHRAPLHAGDLRRGLRHPALRRPGLRALCRSSRAQERAVRRHRHDDARHRHDRVHADLCDHRHRRADHHARRPHDPGLLGRRRVCDLDDISGRACTGAAPLSLRLLAVCRTGRRGHAGGDCRLAGVARTDARPAPILGLAPAVHRRARDRAGRLLHAHQAGRDAGVPAGEGRRPQAARAADHGRVGQLQDPHAVRIGHRAGRHGVVLCPLHRHADLCDPDPSSGIAGVLHRTARGRRVDDGRSVRSAACSPTGSGARRCWGCRSCSCCS